jgi:hypothetical protein
MQEARMTLTTLDPQAGTRVTIAVLDLPADKQL